MAAALVFMLAFSFTAMAQTTGSIRGVVTDDTGAVLPGATVTISSDVLIGSTRTTVTNEVGVFRFPSLSVGTYSVEVVMQGFETVRVDVVEVNLNSTANVPITLKIGGVTEAGFADLRLQSPDEDFVADDWVLPRRLMFKFGLQF
jgi:hypothetical protein